MSEDTEIMRRTPWLKVALDYLAKAIALAIVGTFVSWLDHRDAKDQTWRQVGPHLQDLVKEVQTEQHEIDVLKTNK
jgi:hypothetical protein